MVIEGRWVMSEDETKRHRADALLALQDAKQNLSFLRTSVDQMSKRFYRAAELLQCLMTSNDYVHGPAVNLLQLPEMEYGEPQNLAAVKALVNAIVAAQRQVAEASQHAHDLGV